MLQLGVQTRARFLTAYTEVSEVVPELLLMGRTEAAPDPSPQHQPIDHTIARFPVAPYAAVPKV
jgi:hypothetical protein